MVYKILIVIFAFGSASVIVYNLLHYLVKLGEFKKLPKKYVAGPSAFIRLLKPILVILAERQKKYLPVTWGERVQKLLDRAGNPNQLTPATFFALKEVAAFLATFVVALLALAVPFLKWIIVPAGILGFFLPSMSLKEQAQKRVRVILKDLPFALDLLTLSVEAGQDFVVALQNVVEKGKTGPLLDEFSLLVKQIRMGKSRVDALREMADRVGLLEISSFTSALIQADIMGTSIGKTLRIQSDQGREERFQRAEKVAMEAPVKLIFPLVAFIFPTVFIMIFVPLILKLIQAV